MRYRQGSFLRLIGFLLRYVDAIVEIGIFLAILVNDCCIPL
jgi:hypothetical protein